PFKSVLLSFFFSSRRRHTRFSRDWSSDVCSSDLNGAPNVGSSTVVFGDDTTNRFASAQDALMYRVFNSAYPTAVNPVGTTRKIRSEERRVGKECRTRWAQDH